MSPIMVEVDVEGRSSIGGASVISMSSPACEVYLHAPKCFVWSTFDLCDKRWAGAFRSEVVPDDHAELADKKATAVIVIRGQRDTR